VYAVTLATLSVQVLDAGAAVCSQEHWSFVVFRFSDFGPLAAGDQRKQQSILLCQTAFVIVVCAMSAISTAAILFDAISGAGPWYCIACGLLFSAFMAKSFVLLYNIYITYFTFAVALSLLLCVVL